MLAFLAAAALATATAAPPEPVPCATAPEGMACIPGGAFERGVDADPHTRCWQMGRPQLGRGPDSVPADQVWLQTFFMDRTEVTYAAYKACEAAGRCPKAGPRYDDFDAPEQPMTGVTWDDAVAFCTAQGKHLPTEAQWEKAARGPDGKLNPWGNEPATCERAVIKDERGRSCGVAKRGRSASKGKPGPVGSRPAGVYGLYDMVGNIEEWVYDWYTPSWRACGAACKGVDPTGPCGGRAPCPGYKHRSVRGGSWYWSTIHASGVHRRPHTPFNRMFHHFGFRCAASVSEAATLPR